MDRREIRLQALNKGVPPVIHMVQGDTGRVLRMYPEDMSAASFQSAVLAVHRPDDSYYSITCDFDDKDYFDADMTQALTRPGRVACQLKVSYSADMVSTYTFYVMVEPSTDGLPVEQLGYDIYDLIEAAETITPSPGLTDDIKQALLDCFEHVAWTDEHGQDYVDALEAALYPPAELVSISAVYTQSGTVYTTDTLDSLKTNLVVTAHYSDSTTETVTTYTLSGTLTEGTSVITVSYGGKTTTFTVVVSQELYVTDGLVHWWDAIDNTSNGHDSAATTWKDLVGDMDLSKLSGSTSSWESDALVFTGNSNSEWTADSSETIYNKTVEVAITVTQSSSRLVLFAFSSNIIGKFAVFQDNSFNVTGTSGKSYNTGENSILDLHHIAGVYGATGNIAGVYGNGTPKTQGDNTHSFSGTEPHMVVGGTVHYSFIGKIHSIRMYNRQLTADEIARNYASDVARFGLE